MVDFSIENIFSIQVFLIVLRETLELAIIVSVLLAFLHQSFSNTKEKTNSRNVEENSHSGEHRRPEEGSSSASILSMDEELRADVYTFLKLQVWIGGLLGLVACLFIGSIILFVFYWLGNDLWSSAEHYWEGTFSIVASIIISVMGVKILRVHKMQEKWKSKLVTLIERSDYLNKALKHHAGYRERAELGSRFSQWSEKYSMFILPFVTTLREGMEAIVFIGGIGLNENTSIWAIINSLVLAIITGCSIGLLLYRSGNSLSLQWFLISSTGFLYVVAAGLFSKGIWHFELQRFINLCGGLDVSETGHGPGSYDISKSVWHVNCCNGELQDDGAFWMMVTAIFGWTNSATYGSVISYNIYWIIIIIVFRSLIYEERNGYLPLVPLKWQQSRINKRNKNYQPLASSNGRESADSIDSETPLNA
ncbi:uncharacterized protein PRCAT00000245001 [Priceomyces carsonii]|uniref:uncharacterized protein n=1 Tax=Priceomyces carsonii TaxID=28549 RepID=UPI002EDAF019|nr:unnamed protein product [Priceomyces carsonii]